MRAHSMSSPIYLPVRNGPTHGEPTLSGINCPTCLAVRIFWPYGFSRWFSVWAIHWPQNCGPVQLVAVHRAGARGARRGGARQKAEDEKLTHTFVHKSA